jgi:hypothetical protein
LTATFSLNDREGNGLNDEYLGICADRDVRRRLIKLSDDVVFFCSFEEILIDFSRLRHVNNCSISFCKSSVSSFTDDLIETFFFN